MGVPPTLDVTDQLQLRGIMAIAQKQWETAEQTFQALIALQPNRAEAYFNLGLAQQSQGKEEEAIASFNTALQQKGRHAGAALEAGKIFEARQEWQRAIWYYHHATCFQPKSPTAHLRLGVCQQHQGKIEAAIKHFEIAIGLSPDFEEAYYHLGVAHRIHKDYAQARVYLEYSQDQNPERAEAYYQLCLTHLELGNPECARALYQEFLKRSPDFHQPTFYVAIAAYRDPELVPTVRDAYNKALCPERLSFGIILQWEPEEDEDFPAQLEDYPCQIVSIKATQARGLCWARALGQRLLYDEDYTLQLDSHHRFVEGWDLHLLDLISQCRSPKPLLTSHPAAYIPPNQILPNYAPNRLSVLEFDEDGMCHPVGADNLATRYEPQLGGIIAGGFIFAPSDLYREVPYDPLLYFSGEEIVFSMRTWTHGWDIYHPQKTVLYHYYQRNNSGSKHWEDNKAWHSTHLRSVQRIKQLWRLSDNSDNPKLPELGIYDFGSVRTFRQYQEFMGIDFAKCEFTENADKGIPNTNVFPTIQQVSLNQRYPKIEFEPGCYVKISNFLSEYEHHNILNDTLTSLAAHSFFKDECVRSNSPEANSSDLARHALIDFYPQDNVPGFKLFETNVTSLFTSILNLLDLPLRPLVKLEVQRTIYPDRGHYLRHQDVITLPEQDSQRYLTFAYNFHQKPKAYQGGELVMHRDNLGLASSIEMSQAPEDNSIIFFSSSKYHEVRPVILSSGYLEDSRFTLNGWFHIPAR